MTQISCTLDLGQTLAYCQIRDYLTTGVWFKNIIMPKQITIHTADILFINIVWSKSAYELLLRVFRNQYNK